MKKQPVKLIQIPEEKLKELLGEKTPEEFLEENSAELEQGKHFQKRSKAAFWSQLWLGFSACFSLIGFLFDKDIENGISFLLLASMTYVETKVYKWFLEGDVRAAHYGYWNQTLFTALFLLYGGYHYYSVSVIPEISTAIGSHEFDQVFLQASKLTYATIGILGGGCQYLLALHYQNALYPKHPHPKY